MSAFRSITGIHRLVPLSLCLSGGLCLIGCALLSTSAPGTSFPGSVSDVIREIEEADIVKVDDGFLYIANPYTGLRIIDATDVQQPRMMGRVPLGGRSVELFVQNGVALVLTAADFLNCAGEPIGFEQAVFDPQVVPDYEGSRLWVVDVSDADSPTVVRTVDFDGFVTDTRRVGDVIYATGNAFFGSDDEGDAPSIFDRGAFVASINVADPAGAFLVETELFPGFSLDIHVDNDALYVYGKDSDVFDTSVVSYVDISDPAGDIAVRDQFRVPGTVRNRFFVDAHNGAFRIVTEEFIESVFSRVVALYVFDVTNPDEITRVARFPIAIDARVTAVRFDGDRAYADIASRESPLSVLDVSDPANPRITAELDVPGVGSKLIPLGDRLVAFGFDTSAGVRPSVILYDVADPAAPRRLSSVVVGNAFDFSSGSAAAVDDRSLRVLEDAGLILLPFSEYDRETGLFADSVLFIELRDTDLREGGVLQHAGFVKRAGVLDTRLWLLSNRSFQTVNIDDLDVPASLAAIEIIGEQELLDAGLSGCENSARRETTSVFSVPNPCGTLGLVPLVGMFAGFVGLRWCGVRGRP